MKILEREVNDSEFEDLHDLMSVDWLISQTEKSNIGGKFEDLK